MDCTSSSPSSVGRRLAGMWSTYITYTLTFLSPTGEDKIDRGTFNDQDFQSYTIFRAP